MTYDSSGKGSGWVGEVYVDVQARSIAPGRYTAKFQVRTSSKTLPWAANDGHLTLLEDGTLQVQYPSSGIREYWRHADGCGAQILREAREQFSSNLTSDDAKENDDPATNRTRKRQRAIKLVFRHFGNSVGAKNDGFLWHWGLSVDDSIYEVNGAMAVMGPDGIVAASSPLVKHVRTNLKQFHGYLDVPHTTRKTDEDIEEFSRRWVKLHPVYKALGPNCQTYAEDLFTFLTGEDLPFAKAADRVLGPGGSTALEGPEVNPSAKWLVPSKNPARRR
jgi:sarcosine oxidase delta subunit